MNSYHVYFSVKKGMDDAAVASILARLIESETKSNFMRNARVIKMADDTPDLMNYHFIADYESQADLDEAVKNMEKRYREEPHASVMNMVSKFRVAFSKDLETV